MSIFNSDELLKALTGNQKNPLRTIGFSSELLRLGLNEDELWSFAKKVARDLTAILHPDANNSDEREAAVGIRQAFESLKDKNVFLRSLDELKKAYNEDRSNENLKKRSLEAQENRLEELSRKLRQAEREKENLSQHIIDLNAKLVAKMGSDIILITNPKGKVRQPIQQIRMLRQAKLALAMFLQVSPWSGVLQTPNRLEEILEKYQVGRKRALQQIANFNRTHDSHRKLGGVNGDLVSGHVEKARHDLFKGGFGSKVFQKMVEEVSKDTIPVLNWDFDQFLTQCDVVKGGQANRNTSPPHEIFEQSSFDFNTICETYRSKFDEVVNFLSPHLDRISEVYIYPEIIDVSGGMLGDNIIVGSAFLEDQNVRMGETPNAFALGSFPMDLKRRYLCEGALVATAPPEKMGVVGKTAQSRANKVSENLAGRITSKEMFSSHILLEFLD